MCAGSTEYLVNHIANGTEGSGKCRCENKVLTKGMEENRHHDSKQHVNCETIHDYHLFVLSEPTSFIGASEKLTYTTSPV